MRPIALVYQDMMIQKTTHQALQEQRGVLHTQPRNPAKFWTVESKRDYREHDKKVPRRKGKCPSSIPLMSQYYPCDHFPEILHT